MTNQSAYDLIAVDHYMIDGPRRRHPRDHMDSPLAVPGTTDYQCFSCLTPWPCDVNLLLVDYCNLREALYAFVEPNVPDSFRVRSGGYSTCYYCMQNPHKGDCLAGKAALVLGDTKDTIAKAGSRTPRG